MADEIRGSYLIQRLNAPYPQNSLFAKAGGNPFSFGGGLMNGGLSKEAMEMLSPLFSFDYMGAAEYEFGEVPRAFGKVLAHAQAGELVAATVDVPLSSVPEGWQEEYERKQRKERKKPLKGTARVHLLCPSDWVDEVTARILAWATVSRTREEYWVRDDTNLSRVLRKMAVPDSPDYDHPARGWIELENGFMFFVDQDMWAGVADLFGVKAEVPA